MQAAAPAPSTPRQPATTAHAHFVSSPSGTLGADLDFKLRSSVTRTPFTTPRGPPTPPDSGNKPVSVSFSLPLKTTMSHDSPLAQKTFDSASDAHASMTRASPSPLLPRAPLMQSSQLHPRLEACHPSRLRSRHCLAPHHWTRLPNLRAMSSARRTSTSTASLRTSLKTNYWP
jgi:hypothetical protein